ncbi:MAG: undecaprenyl-diphosphate phosphatase [Candidatus Omnitrophota bacterium]|jgi:undecaprenyl-diphosphatase
MLYAILGIIQGLTEFLPVSSSGHLVLFSHIFNIDRTQILPIVIVCHLGTLFALVCFFARDIWRIAKDLVVVIQILVVTLITGVFVLVGRKFFEQLFQKPSSVCLALLITAVILILTYRGKKEGRGILALNIKDAIWLGISQGIAVIPGISRSGITIFSLLVRGVDPQAAFKFSFLAGIPAILGIFVLEVKEIGFAFNNNPTHFWLAFGMSFIFGILGLFILKRVVKRLKLHYFGYYLLLASTLGFIFVK